MGDNTCVLDSTLDLTKDTDTTQESANSNSNFNKSCNTDATCMPDQTISVTTRPLINHRQPYNQTYPNGGIKTPDAPRSKHIPTIPVHSLTFQSAQSLEFENYPLGLVAGSPESHTCRQDICKSEDCSKTKPGTFYWNPLHPDPEHNKKNGYVESVADVESKYAVLYSKRSIEESENYSAAYFEDLHSVSHRSGKVSLLCCSNSQMCCEQDEYLESSQPYSNTGCCTTWCRTIRNLCRCPPVTHMAHFLTLLLGTFLTWAILWTVVRDDALPGGNIFALTALITSGYFAGKVFQFIKLPNLLGMLLMGCVFRNVPSISLDRDVNMEIASKIRLLCMSVVILRAGLALDPSSLSRLVCVVLRLAVMPCMFESVAVAVASHILLEFPWIWSFMLGFLISSVCPAVVVPCMLKLRDQGLGVESGIPTLLIAASNVDQVLALTGFAIIIGVNFSTGSLVWNVFHGPMEALLGITYGAVMGLLLWFLPSRYHKKRDGYRGCILLLLGVFAMFGSQAASVPGAGALACLVVPFVASIGWRRQGVDVYKSGITSALATLWSVLEPVLFSLIGLEVDIAKLHGHISGVNVAVLLLGLGVRIIVTVMATIGAKFSTSEKIFVPLAWLPKATVQAALGSLALDTAILQSSEEEEVELGRRTLAMAMLSILLLAPIGSVLITVTGPLLLKRKTRHPTQVDTEDDDLPSMVGQDLTWDDHLDFDTELTKLKVELPVEITTEIETVT